MDYAVHVVEIGEAFEYGNGDHSDHVDVDGAYALVDSIKRALVHKLHADADVRVRQECTVKRDDVS